jgi:hypothetical protein
MSITMHTNTHSLSQSQRHRVRRGRGVRVTETVSELGGRRTLPYPGYAIQIASYGMRYVGIFAERICVKHP